MPTVTVAPNGEPEEAPPAYDIERALQILRGAQPGPAPVAPAPGFLDRLGAGLANIQAPAGGRGGDAFGANLIAGFGRTFGGGRVAAREAALKAQLEEYERGNALKAQEAQARIGALGKDYEAKSALALRRAGREPKEAKPDTDVTITPGMAKRYPRFRGLEGQKLSRAKFEDVATEKPEKPAKDDPGRLVQIMGPQGTPVWVRESDAVGKPAAQAARAVTGQERQALAYYNRAKQALETLESPDKSGQSLEVRIGKSGLMSQAQLQFAPNAVQSPEQRAYRQAQRAFTEARLRKESGAAIPTPEYENDARTYFAQPGDDAATIEQKRQARQVVLDGLRFGSGKAYDEFYGESAPRQTQPGPSAATPKPGGFFDQNAPGRK